MSNHFLKRSDSAAATAFLLALMTLFTFWPITGFDFVNYDDLQYVTENPMVQKGVCVESVRWAFTATHASNWHPLTWISHELDWQVYGKRAGGHHVTSLSLHMASTLLLFFIFRRMTGAHWRSAMLAGLFAVHPLRVESVAWVAERKDVLGTFFFLFAIWAYARYARGADGGTLAGEQVAVKPVSRARLGYYLFSLVLFVLGLMSKPMVVTLPFVLLLLDYWPLRRWDGTPGWTSLTGEKVRPHPGPLPQERENVRKSAGDSEALPDTRVLERKMQTAGWLVLEKVPFLLLCGVVSVVTFVVQKNHGAVVALKELSYSTRLANAMVSYVRYLGKMLWPAGLTPLYTYEFAWARWQVLLAGLLLFAVSALAVREAKLRPYCLVGWLWYLGTLVPVIGLIQVGSQSIADRYTYIPLIGIFLILVWGGSEMLLVGTRSKVAGGLVCAVVLGLCIGRTRDQLWHWRSAEALFRHAIALNPKNAVAYNNLGCCLIPEGRIAEAKSCFETAIKLQLSCGDPYINLGWILAQQGKTQEAFNNYQIALAINTNDVSAHVRMGTLLVGVGSVDEGLWHLQEAVRLNPIHVDAVNDLGIAYTKKDELDKALIYFQSALWLRPNYPEALNNIGNVMTAQKQPEKAVTYFREALRLRPDYINARYDLADALDKTGKREEAIQELKTLLARKPDDAGAHNRMGEILSQQGKTRDALRSYETALRLDPDFPEAMENKAWILATSPQAEFRQGDEATKLARRALELTSAENIRALDALAAAYAESGRFDQAAETAGKALSLAHASKRSELATEIEARLALYRSGKAFREP